MILFETTLFKDTASVIGEPETNDADRTDFETNFKPTANTIDSLVFPDTRPLLVVDWTELKTKFSVGADIYYIESDDRYIIYAFSEGINPSMDVSLFDKSSNILGIVDIEGVKVLQVFDVASGQETDTEGGTGSSFKKISYASEIQNIGGGGKNKISIRPRVLIENMIEDINNVQTLGGSITDVGQVFRLTGGIMDINHIHMTLEAEAGGAITSVDDLESYADTAALRAVWVPNDTTNTPNTLETSITFEGSQAMAVEMQSKQKSKSDEFELTYGSVQDWSLDNGIQMQFRNDTNAVIEIHIEDDNGDASKHTVTTSGQGSYEFIQLNFDDFIPVGAVPVDLTDVKKIKFFVKTASVGFFYVDLMEVFSTSSFGTVDAELYDFGTDSSPTALGTLLTTETIDLESGKKVYSVPISQIGLTPNNFYGIVLTNPSTATVKVYGKNGSDRYVSGFAFDSTDNGTNIAGTGAGDDLFFLVFALDKAVFNGVKFTFNADPGQGVISAFINDNASFKGRTSLFLGENTMSRKEIEFATKKDTGVGTKMNEDELVLVDYEADGTSLATKMQTTVYYTFIDRPLNG